MKDTTAQVEVGNSPNSDHDSGQGPTYIVDIEGVNHPWLHDMITYEEIAALGGWEPSQGVIEIDVDNNERTLKSGELVQLKPGLGFAKKIRWKRGENLVQSRINEELALLRSRFDQVDYVPAGHWFRVRDYQILSPGWSSGVINVVFQVPDSYPGTRPYGIYVPSGLRYQDKTPENYREPASNQPPFEGAWGFFSWEPDDGQWRPTAAITSGTNLLNFVIGFNDRFCQGI